MSQALNYCRDLVKDHAALLNHAAIPEHTCKKIWSAHFLGQRAIKFCLPDNGVIFEDHQFKAMSDDTLHLPYPEVALEFRSYVGNVVGTAMAKNIIFASEREADIMIFHSQCLPKSNQWTTEGAVALQKSDYLDRSLAKADGTPPVRLYGMGALDEQGQPVPLESMKWSAYVLLQFLNTLNCSNIGTQQADNPQADRWAKLSPRKQARQLPPDVYYVLTIKPHATASGDTAGAATGSERKPVREHLRRGHIRRLASGARLWINAAVVMPGLDAGRVTKDYRMVP